MITDLVQEYVVPLNINPWGIANKYAEEKVPMIPDVSTVKDWEHFEEVKDAVEYGFCKAIEILMDQGKI